MATQVLRVHSWAFTGAVWYFALAAPLAAQATVIDDPVRITVRGEADGASGQR